VLNTVVVDIDIDLASILTDDPSLEVTALQLCLSLDIDTFKQCWPLLSASGLPVFDFFESSTGTAQLLQSDAVTGTRQHTLQAWLAFEPGGFKIAQARADFTAWSIEAHSLNETELQLHRHVNDSSSPDIVMQDRTHNNSTSGVHLTIRVGRSRSVIVVSNKDPFSAYLRAASRAVKTSLWPVASYLVAETRSQPLPPPFRVVELPFVRSGDTFGRTFCTSSELYGSDSSCEAFALVEAMLKVLAARPLCSIASSPSTLLRQTSQLDTELKVDKIPSQAWSIATSERRARLLVLGSSSAWVWCGGADSDVVAVEAGTFAEVGAHDDSGAGSLWCRGRPTDSDPGGSGIDVRVVPGASASGLNNADSVTGALKEFRKVLRGDLMEGSGSFSAQAQSTNVYEGVVLMVGEVDRSSTLWLKAARRLRSMSTNFSLESFSEANSKTSTNTLSAAALIEAAKVEAAEAAARLMKFASQEMNDASALASHAPVVVMAAPLPTMTRRDMMRLAYPHLVDNEDLHGEVLASEPFECGVDQSTQSNDDASASEVSAKGPRNEASISWERTVADETAVTLALNDHMRRKCSAAASAAAAPGVSPGDSATKAEVSNTQSRTCLFADATNDWLDATTGEVHNFFLAAMPDIHAHLERSFFFWKRALVIAGAAQWCSEFN
jgi:hypothetical protein